MGWKTKEQRDTYNKKYREDHADELREKRHAYYLSRKEYVKEWGKEYRRKNAKRIYERNRKYQTEHKDKVVQWVEAYKKKYPLKARAQQTAKAIPMADKCEACGRKATDRHHPDYTKPREVTFLCRRCHKLLHRR